jgi:hypothetical protein
MSALEDFLKQSRQFSRDQVTELLQAFKLENAAGDNNEHLIAGGAVPVVTLGVGAGEGAALGSTIHGVDSAGKVIVHTGLETPPDVGTIFTLTFNKPFASAPYVAILPADGNAAGLARAGKNVYTDHADVTTALFKLSSDPTNALATDTEYAWFYIVIGQV